MKRCLFTVFAAGSLLLFVAVCVMWVRSYRGTDYLLRGKLVNSSPDTVVTCSHQISWTRGSIRVAVEERTYYANDAPLPAATDDTRPRWGLGRLGIGRQGWEELPQRSSWNRLGFHVYEHRGILSCIGDVRFAGIAVPAWLPAAVLATPPLLWVSRLFRDRRNRRRGLCPACGYDLRASPERCPECGTAAPAPAGPSMGST